MTPSQIVQMTALLYRLIVLGRKEQLTVADRLLVESAASQAIHDLTLPTQNPHYDLAATAALVKRTIITPALAATGKLYVLPNSVRPATEAASRHVRQASRDRVLQSVNSDSRIHGWARMETGAETCAFCSLLVSRGAVYRSEQTASFTSHDHCDCIAVPVFKNKKWAGQAHADELYRQYRSATAGYSGQDAINAWRRHYESSAAKPAAA